MRNFVLVAFLMVTWTVAAHAASIWLSDYHGTIGEGEDTQVISLSMSKDDGGYEQDCDFSNISKANLYYKETAELVPMTVTERDGRKAVFATVLQDGALSGRLEVEFVEKDPKNSYKTDEPLCEDVMVGTWHGSPGKGGVSPPQPVYLRVAHSLTVQEDGGRCHMSGEEYAKVEQRIKDFQKAMAAGDAETLQKDFGYAKELSDEYRQLVINDIPHSLFCNNDGVMLGSGVVWFDTEGNVINP